LQANGWLYGGESSGHILCLDVTSTGDGIISALQVLAAMQKEGRSLHEIKQGMAKYPQTMINVKMAARDKLANNPVISEAQKAVEAQLGTKGRVLLRPSGTEPVVRVMVEGEDGSQVANLAQQLADAVREALA
jgi:phosphoglucosamine mutase